MNTIFERNIVNIILPISFNIIMFLVLIETVLLVLKLHVWVEK